MNNSIIKNKITSRFLAQRGILIAFLGLLFARDFLGETIPLHVFTVIWILGIMVWDFNMSTAFTVSVSICFTSNISITIPIAVYIGYSFYKYGTKIKVNTFLVISALIAIQEYCRFSSRYFQSMTEYVSRIMIVFLVAFVITLFDFDDIKPESILKYYLTMYAFLIIDIIYATAHHLGSLSMIVSEHFRIGNTDRFVEESSLLSMNANGIALLSMIAICSALVLIHYKKFKLSIAVPFIVFSSVAGFLTISKTFILVYTGAMSMWLIWYAYSHQRSVIKTLGIILIFVCAVLILLQTPMVENVFERFETGDLTTGRVEIMGDYLEYMSDQNFFVKLFGIGIQNVNAKAGMMYVPHNAIIEIFVTIGFIGLIYYTLFFYKYLKRPNELCLMKYNKTPLFINYIPFITYFTFIQSLQFIRIGYIYGSLITLFACMMCCENKQLTDDKKSTSTEV